MTRKNDDLCEVQHTHPEKIQIAKLHEVDDTTSLHLAEIFKVLGDQTRIKLLSLLYSSEEMCVCDIGALLEMSTPAISHHLKVLRQLKLVTFRRSGKIVYYTIADEHISPILSQALAHIKESDNG